MRFIDVQVLPSGEVKMEVSGAQGSECKLLTEPFEKALGGEAKSTPKPEMYQQAPQQQGAAR